MDKQAIIFKNEKKFSFRDYVEKRKKRIVYKFLNRLNKEHLHNNRKQLVVFSYDYIALKITMDGVYEINDLETLFKWLHPGLSLFKEGSAIDIGANIGNHSLFFSDYFSDVYSFEPNPRTFRVLKINAELASNVKCFNCGISDNNGEAVLNFDAENIGYARISSDIKDNSQKIELIRLDDFTEIQSPLKFIKIDVEGHELHVIKGAENTIREYEPLIVFEQNKKEFVDGTTPSIDLLKEYGYKKFACIEKFPQPSKIKPRFLRIFVDLWKQFKYQSSLNIVVKDDFEAKNYSFIIAIPSWIE